MNNTLAVLSLTLAGLSLLKMFCDYLGGKNSKLLETEIKRLNSSNDMLEASLYVATARNEDLCDVRGLKKISQVVLEAGLKKRIGELEAANEDLLSKITNNGNVFTNEAFAWSDKVNELCRANNTLQGDAIREAENSVYWQEKFENSSKISEGRAFRIEQLVKEVYELKNTDAAKNAAYWLSRHEEARANSEKLSNELVSAQKTITDHVCNQKYSYNGYSWTCGKPNEWPNNGVVFDNKLYDGYSMWTSGTNSRQADGYYFYNWPNMYPEAVSLTKTQGEPKPILQV